MDYLTYRSVALQSLSLVKNKSKNKFTKDEIEDHIKAEYKRHYLDNKGVV